jgi:hypothetical protein
MRGLHQPRRAVGFGVVCLFVIALSPLVLLAGELVNRHYLGSWRAGAARPLGRRPVAARRLTAGTVRYSRVCSVTSGHRLAPLATPFLVNPLWIALTAPARWLLGRRRPRAGRRGGGSGRPPAGVREPRRPRPDVPAGVIALPEPREPA